MESAALPTISTNFVSRNAPIIAAIPSGFFSQMILAQRGVISKDSQLTPSLWHYWADAEFFLYQKFRTGYHPVHVELILQKALQLQGLTEYATLYMESALVMIQNLRKNAKFGDLPSFATYQEFRSTSGNSVEKRDFDAMMNERFKNRTHFRGGSMDPKTAMKLTAAPKLDELSKKAIDSAFLALKLDLDLKKKKKAEKMVNFESGGRSSTPETHGTGDEVTTGFTTPPSKSSRASSTGKAKAPNPAASMFFQASNTLEDPFLDSATAVKEKVKPQVYRLAPPPVNRGGWKSRELEASPTMRVKYNKKSTSTSLLSPPQSPSLKYIGHKGTRISPPPGLDIRKGTTFLSNVISSPPGLTGGEDLGGWMSISSEHRHDTSHPAFPPGLDVTNTSLISSYATPPESLNVTSTNLVSSYATPPGSFGSLDEHQNMSYPHRQGQETPPTAIHQSSDTYDHQDQEMSRHIADQVAPTLLSHISDVFQTSKAAPRFPPGLDINRGLQSQLPLSNEYYYDSTRSGFGSGSKDIFAGYRNVAKAGNDAIPCSFMNKSAGLFGSYSGFTVEIPVPIGRYIDN